MTRRFPYNDYDANDKIHCYDYGTRFYDAALGRFMVKDRFAEKYFDFTPYQYAANNPILFIDVNGDSINVAEQYREQFMSDMQQVFGDKANSLSFNKNGNLILEE